MKKTVVIFDDLDAEYIAKGLDRELGVFCLPYLEIKKCFEDIKNGLEFDLLLTDFSDEREREIDICKRGGRPQL